MSVLEHDPSHPSSYLPTKSDISQTLKFGIGNGHVRHCLFNCRCAGISPEEVGLIFSLQLLTPNVARKTGRRESMTSILSVSTHLKGGVFISLMCIMVALVITIDCKWSKGECIWRCVWKMKRNSFYGTPERISLSQSLNGGSES